MDEVSVYPNTQVRQIFKKQKYSKRNNQGIVFPLREPSNPKEIRQGYTIRVPEHPLPTQIKKKGK